jgi:hypothetical protein
MDHVRGVPTSACVVNPVDQGIEVALRERRAKDNCSVVVHDHHLAVLHALIRCSLFEAAHYDSFYVLISDGGIKVPIQFLDVTQLLESLLDLDVFRKEGDHSEYQY